MLPILPYPLCCLALLTLPLAPPYFTTYPTLHYPLHYPILSLPIALPYSVLPLALHIFPTHCYILPYLTLSLLIAPHYPYLWPYPTVSLILPYPCITPCSNQPYPLPFPTPCHAQPFSLPFPILSHSPQPCLSPWPTYHALSLTIPYMTYICHTYPLPYPTLPYPLPYCTSASFTSKPYFTPCHTLHCLTNMYCHCLSLLPLPLPYRCLIPSPPLYQTYTLS